MVSVGHVIGCSYLEKKMKESALSNDIQHIFQGILINDIQHIFQGILINSRKQCPNKCFLITNAANMCL